MGVGGLLNHVERVEHVEVGMIVWWLGGSCETSGTQTGTQHSMEDWRPCRACRGWGEIFNHTERVEHVEGLSGWV